MYILFLFLFLFLVGVGFGIWFFVFNKKPGDSCKPYVAVPGGLTYVYTDIMTCVAKTCKNGYTALRDGGCIIIGGECSPPPQTIIPENGKPFVYDKNGKCSFPGCKDGYTFLNNGKCGKVGEKCKDSVGPAGYNIDYLFRKDDFSCTGIKCVTGYELVNGECKQQI